MNHSAFLAAVRVSWNNPPRRAALALHLKLILLLGPAVGLIAGLYLGGLLLGGLQSLGYFPAAGLERFSLDAYRALFSRPDFYRSLLLTLWVALASTGVAMLLAVASALLLHRALRLARPGRRWISFLYQFNLPVPHSIGAISIFLLFSQSGLLARLAYAGGLIHAPAEFPALVFDRFGVGIILEYAWKTTVFIGVTLLAALETAGDEYEAAARTLGAGAWQRFRYVTLPLLRPALLSSSILVFAFTFSGYEAPYLLGQRSVAMLPGVAYREYNRVDLAARPEAMALCMLIAAFSSILVWLYMHLMERQWL